MSVNWKSLRSVYETGEDAPAEVIRAYNDMPDKLSALSRYVREELLAEPTPDPYLAARFIEWIENNGGETFDPLGMFEVGNEVYEIEQPERVREWLEHNMEDGSWTMEESGRSQGVRRYRVTLSEGDKTLFRVKWI